MEISTNPDDNRVTREDMKRVLPAMLRGTPLGIFIGAIPGIGSSIAAFLSYGLTKRLSKNPDEFGKGSVEGVAAAESANKR